MASTAPIKIRFELPRGELQRAAAAATAQGPRFAAASAAAGPSRFDETHLVGRLRFEVGVPLVSDPVLAFLREKRGLVADPPLAVVLDQPLAYALGQLASASVLALHGEGAFTVALKGGAGALTVAFEDGVFDLGVPLAQYAGLAPLPPQAAAGAVAEACAALAVILRGEPALASWPYVEFLEREERILRAFAGGARPAPPAGLPDTWRADRFSASGKPVLSELLCDAERAGAHVVPYWRATAMAAGGGVAFEPLRTPSRGSKRGALARFILPGEDRSLQVSLADDEPATARLRGRLGRPTPFALRFGAGGKARIEEAGGALPVV